MPARAGAALLGLLGLLVARGVAAQTSAPSASPSRTPAGVVYVWLTPTGHPSTSAPSAASFCCTSAPSVCGAETQKIWPYLVGRSGDAYCITDTTITTTHANGCSTAPFSFPSSTPVYSPTYVQISTTYTKFVSSPTTTTTMNAAGLANDNFWTGALANGCADSSNDCTAWTSTSGNVELGNTPSQGWWNVGSFSACGESHKYLCACLAAVTGSPSKTPSRSPSRAPSRSPSRAPSKTPSKTPNVIYLFGTNALHVANSISGNAGAQTICNADFLGFHPNLACEYTWPLLDDATQNCASTTGPTPARFQDNSPTTVSFPSSTPVQGPTGTPITPTWAVLFQTTPTTMTHNMQQASLGWNGAATSWWSGGGGSPTFCSGSTCTNWAPSPTPQVGTAMDVSTTAIPGWFSNPGTFACTNAAPFMCSCYSGGANVDPSTVYLYYASPNASPTFTPFSPPTIGSRANANSLCSASAGKPAGCTFTFALVLYST
jgi:hypothetical protein